MFLTMAHLNGCRPMTIRVYIVEDHPIMRQTLVDFLGVYPDIELAGMASCAEDAVAGIESCDPDLVLLDLSLPGRSGIELLGDIKEKWDGMPCLILSGHGERSHLDRAFGAGACGYILKGRPQEVPLAIRMAMDGKVYLSDALRRVLPQGLGFGT